MKLKIATALLAMSAMALAQAQNTPVGRWHTIDDKSKEVRSEVTIFEVGGALTGRISKLLAKDAKQDSVCDKCTDARKDKAVLGLDIIRGAKKDGDENVWVGGKILDPENGKEYTLKLTPKDGGTKLDVRGSIGPFGRTQTWVRVP